MCQPPENCVCLDNQQYISNVTSRIDLKISGIKRRLLAGDLKTAADLLMTIHDDTAEIAEAWDCRYPSRGEELA